MILKPVGFGDGRRWWLAATLTVAMPPMACVAAPAGRTVAFLQDDAQARWIEIRREGRPVAYDPGLGFQSCDEVTLKAGSDAAPDYQAVVVWTTTHEALRPSRTPQKIACGEQGVAAAVLSALRAAVASVAPRMGVRAVTRGFQCPKNQASTAPQIAALPSGTTLRMSAGAGPLFLVWQKSFPPYALVLKNPGAAAPLLDLKVGRVATAEIAAIDLRTGIYSLRVTDQCAGQTQYVLRVVAPETRPALPAALDTLPEPQRTLFYADYLASVDAGEWSLEAMRLTAALAPRSPAVERWLSGWNAP